jgi:hypothetical protein
MIDLTLLWAWWTLTGVETSQWFWMIDPWRWHDQPKAKSAICDAFALVPLFLSHAPVCWLMNRTSRRIIAPVALASGKISAGFLPSGAPASCKLVNTCFTLYKWDWRRGTNANFSCLEVLHPSISHEFREALWVRRVPGEKESSRAKFRCEIRVSSWLHVWNFIDIPSGYLT